MKIYCQNDRDSSKIVIYLNGCRKSFGFPKQVLQDKRYRRELEDCFEDIELKNHTGGVLESSTWLTLHQIEKTNPRVFRNLLKWNAVDPKEAVAAKEMSIAEAFDDYVNRVFTSPRTIDNWNQTKKRLVSYFGEKKSIASVTLLEMKQCFAELSKRFAAATLHKDHKNAKQLWRECADNGQITGNPLAKFTYKVNRQDLVATKEYITPAWFDAALACIKSKQHRALFAYYRWVGARQNDPRGDHWEHLELDREYPRVMRSDCKKKRKLGWCPIPPQAAIELRQWREEVIAKEGKASGPIFPWLDGRSIARQHQYYVRRMRQHKVSVWSNFFNSLRASRSREIRALKNGRKLEQLWIGHSEAVADLHYDVGHCDQDQQFIEDNYFEQVCREPEAEDQNPSEGDGRNQGDSGESPGEEEKGAA
jgi:integrase